MGYSSPQTPPLYDDADLFMSPPERFEPTAVELPEASVLALCVLILFAALILTIAAWGVSEMRRPTAVGAASAESE